MNTSESINELATALAKAQGQMTAARMDAENPFLHNHYADLGNVIQAAKKPLADNGLSYSQHPELNGGAVTITTILMHSTGQWIESTITLGLSEGKGMSQAQQMGSVITYLRRYSLSAILGIYADEDKDGNDEKTPSNGKAHATTAPVTLPTNSKAQPAALNGKPAVITEAKVEAAQARVETPVSDELAQAMNLTTSGKNAVCYGDITTGKLAYMVNAMLDADRKPETTDAQKAEHAVKISAARLIMASRPH